MRIQKGISEAKWKGWIHGVSLSISLFPFFVSDFLSVQTGLFYVGKNMPWIVSNV